MFYTKIFKKKNTKKTNLHFIVWKTLFALFKKKKKKFSSRHRTFRSGVSWLKNHCYWAEQFPFTSYDWAAAGQSPDRERASSGSYWCPSQWLELIWLGTTMVLHHINVCFKGSWRGKVINFKRAPGVRAARCFCVALHSSLAWGSVSNTCLTHLTSSVPPQGRSLPLHTLSIFQHLLVGNHRQNSGSTGHWLPMREFREEYEDTRRILSMVSKERMYSSLSGLPRVLLALLLVLKLPGEKAAGPPG